MKLLKEQCKLFLALVSTDATLQLVILWMERYQALKQKVEQLLILLYKVMWMDYGTVLMALPPKRGPTHSAPQTYDSYHQYE